jgi:Protein of unknown function (DUF1353)
MDTPIYKDGDKDDCLKTWDNFHTTLSNGKRLVIPPNFETDWASIPRLFWSLYPPHWKPYRTPSLIHDYLYADQKIITSRAFADAEFRRQLIATNKVHKRTAWLFWACVRLFGQARWNRYKKANEKKETEKKAL